MPSFFSRNIGLITPEDQEKISDSVIGIAGAGADGGLTAERLTRLGIGGLKIADPEAFDLTNINRQFGAMAETIGLNKSSVVSDELSKIRPEMKIQAFPKGITEDNVDSFIDGCSFILDEIEYTLPKLSILLHSHAEKKGLEIYSGLNIGFGINVYRFVPGGVPFQTLVGFNKDSKDSDLDLSKFVPDIPDYVDSEVVKKVLSKESYIPAVSSAVGLLAGYVSFVILGAITGKWSIPAVPEYIHIDMRTMDFKVKKLG